jgi:hypothetical protein
MAVRARLLARVLSGVAPSALVLASATPAQGYTWMARHDYFGCSTCHVDVSGGGLLTPYGRAQGNLLLRMLYDKEEPEEPNTSPLWGLLETPSWLLVGGSYRHMTLYEAGEPEPFRTFPMQADLYGALAFGWFRAGATVGVARVAAGSPHARRAQVTANQGDDFNVLSRTHWAGAELVPAVLTARAGRLELPFGVRIPEHTMWVRDATRTDRESDQQHGVALAYTGNSLRAEAMAILGNYQLHPDRLRERGYSAYGELKVSEWANVGLTTLMTYARTDFQSLDDEVLRQAHGATARVVPVPPLAILIEGDVLARSRRELGYVGFVQLDFELVQGLHFAATGEVLDAGYRDTGDPYDTLPRTPGFGRPGYGGWLTVDWFFLPQLEARLDAVARQSEPFTLLAQLHVYL